MTRVFAAAIISLSLLTACAPRDVKGDSQGIKPDKVTSGIGFVCHNGRAVYYSMSSSGGRAMFVIPDAPECVK